MNNQFDVGTTEVAGKHRLAWLKKHRNKVAAQGYDELEGQP